MYVWIISFNLEKSLEMDVLFIYINVLCKENSFRYYEEFYKIVLYVIVFI